MDNTEHEYELVFFAEKHSLTPQAAKIILAANGPSRMACDAAAKAFLEAVAIRKRQWGRDKT